MCLCERDSDTQGVFPLHAQCPWDRPFMNQDKALMSVNMVHSILSDSCGTAVFIYV